MTVPPSGSGFLLLCSATMRHSSQLTTVFPPSGSQHQIRAGDHGAIIAAVGACLRSLRWGGRELLDGFGEGEMCTGSRGQVLVPWPNRVRDGRYDFGGHE